MRTLIALLLAFAVVVLLLEFWTRGTEEEGKVIEIHAPTTVASTTTLPTTTTTVAPTTTTVARTAPIRAVSVSRPTPSGDIWWALFGCETGQTYNPRIVSKTGKFRGAFQFSLSTWASIGETGDPIDYPYEHQLAAAKRLQARDGWHPWPTCARRLGLLR